jgi:prolipoprotein diacylglyceryltransferase/protein-S-isoprenylcysteine O-methyltransferase Ste14
VIGAGEGVRSPASPWWRLAYATLFVVVLPTLLILWARRLDGLVRLVPVGPTGAGVAIAAAGAALALAGVWTLRTQGGGWPMSPFPPTRLVNRGVYRIIADPIYVGAALVCLGATLAFHSGAGIFVVTPVFSLAMAAFVIGYERDATRRRFGAISTPLLRLPPATGERAGPWDRVACYLLVLLPWVVLYQAVEYLGVPSDARSAYLSWESHLSVVPWMEALYVFTYPYVLLAPLSPARRRDLRRFALQGLVATAVIIPIYLLLPLVAAAKPVPEGSIWSPLMRWERLNDQPVTAFPAFHVVWACIASRLYSAAFRRARWVFWVIAAGIAASAVLTGMHAVLDVAAAFVVYAVIARGSAVWEWVRRATERVANSWREWTVGPVRLLSHSIPAAVGAAVGVVVALWLAGPDQLGWVLAMFVASVIGAGLWAQVIEGSPQLLRPYGYFGSVLGVLLVVVAAALDGQDLWIPFGAFGVGGCLAQGIGRVRCLIQGCCHGRAADASRGICYMHPRSRVTRLSDLGGVPIHPTPLYSLIWMLFVGAVLMRLWLLAAPLPFVVGSYFVLAGVGRFAEEHYRGEPQTAWIAGMRVYQWLALAFVVGGAVLTAFGGPSAPAPQPVPLSVLAVLPVVALAAYAAFGVDFPGSNLRFSRLV